MSERKKNRRKLSASVRMRVEKIAASVEEMASRLRRAESQLRQQADRARELESKIPAEVAQARARRGGKSAGGNRPDGVVSLEEGYAVDLEQWERKMDEKYSLLSAKERELRELEKKIYAEVEKLLPEIKQRDLFPAPREVELGNLKQNLGARLGELGNLVNKRSAGRKAARLVSFLVDIGKRH